MQDQKSQSFGNAFLNKGYEYEHNFLKNKGYRKNLFPNKDAIKNKTT